MLKEEVDAEDVAEVVSAWTGVPFRDLMEGEIQKLIRLEEVLHQRVIGQDEAVSVVANAIRRSRAGSPTLIARSGVSCSSARPGSARPSWPGPSQISCSTTSER